MWDQPVRRIIVLVLASASGGCGCGGPAGPTINPVTEARPQRRSARVAQAPIVPKAEPPKAPEKREETSPSEEQFEDADLPDVFEIANGEPNYDIIGMASDHRASDVFIASAPAPGTDSSTFDATLQNRASAINEADANEIPLPEGFLVVREAGLSADGLPLRIQCLVDDSVMALVPGGTTTLGQTDGPAAASPQVTVDVGPFYMDVTEVTLAQFERFRAARRDLGRRVPADPSNDGAPGTHPVLGVNWTEASTYSHWVRKELPSEAEWERAARGGTTADVPWGNQRAIWPRQRLPGQIDPVGSFVTDTSSFGIRDLAGNAREWCGDWFDPNRYDALATKDGSQKWTPPREAVVGDQRVVRGSRTDWKVWHRTGLSRKSREPDVGFRCVLRLRRR